MSCAACCTRFRKRHCYPGMTRPRTREPESRLARYVFSWWAPHWLWLTHRTLWAVYFFVWLVLAQYDKGNPYIYVTHWTFFLFTFYQVSMAIITWWGFFHRDSLPLKPPLWVKIVHYCAWIGWSLMVSLPLLVVIIYWVFLFNPAEFDSWGMARNVHIHLVHGIVFVIDVFMTRIPVVFAHYYIPFSLGLLYTFVNVGLVRSGNIYPYIYSILDWNNVNSPLGMVTAIIYIIVLLLIIGPICMFIHYGFSVLRNRFVPHRKLSSAALEEKGAKPNEAKPTKDKVESSSTSS